MRVMICICAGCQKFLGFRSMAFWYAVRSLLTLKFNRFMTSGMCPVCQKKQDKEVEEFLAEQNHSVNARHWLRRVNRSKYVKASI